MNNLKKNESHLQLASSSEVQEVEFVDIQDDAKSYVKLGWMIVLVGVVGFLVWASFAPLDQGVSLSGNVVVASNRKLVQHQNGGTVDTILVKDGDSVKAGQVLVTMNNVVAKSTADISRVQWLSALASEARLKSERDNANTIQFPSELIKAKFDPQVASNLMLQEQLFFSRRTAIQNELAAVDENLAGLKLQQTGIQESMESKKQQLVFLREQLDGMRELSKDGFVPRNRLLDLERTYVQVSGAISEDFGNIGRVTRQLAELSLRKTARQQEYQKEVRTQLNDVSKERESLQNRLTALEYDLKNIEVRAPVDGLVVGSAGVGKGAVVPSGFKLMEIVPKDDALIVEGVLPVHLIDKVHAGLDVELIFAAFNTNTTPHIPGEVIHVAADRTVDERTGQAFYKIKAAVKPSAVKLLDTHQVRAGMPVEMLVKTGERTMMNYLMKPILLRIGSSLKEE